MTDLTRRDAISALGAAALAASGLAACRPGDVDRARRYAESHPGGDFDPQYLTPREVATVVILGDMVIPADERSGSASDAGVPAFIDFVLAEEMTDRTRIRGGLAWLDRESTGRYQVRFVDGNEAQREAILNDIAWPDKAKPEHSQGVAFFNAFRDLVASGFWSSRMGVQDIGYMGNHPVQKWDGCPAEQLRKIGVLNA
jgi:hypothetical protein